MRHSISSLTTKIAAAAIGFGLLALVGTSESVADTRSGQTPGSVVSERFSATTTSMTPRDVSLRIDLRGWSDEAARAQVVAALGSDTDVQEALAALPTIGHVWQSGSAVGYAVKYAHRAPTAEGERITFVTDRRLGSFDLKPWTADQAAAPAPAELGYSVIELYFAANTQGGANGQGAGTLSLAAGVQIDSANGVVSLAPGAPRVLANAKLEPKRR
jgi:hypothetical protein